MSQIHETAVVHSSAELGDNLTVGPYCVIGANAKIGNDCVLASHVVIDGKTTLGAGNHLFPFCSIGHAPQDKKYSGEDSELVIGDGNVIREHVTMNPGTEGGGLVTRVGDTNLFMAGTHVAHDCVVGNNVILANNATLAGHVTVGDGAILGGLSAVHQFARIGEASFVGGMTGVENDVIPFGMVMGNRAHLAGLNLVGLRRSKLPREQIHNLRKAVRILFDDQSTVQVQLELIAEEFPDDPAVQKVIGFIRDSSDRALCVPPR